MWGCGDVWGCLCFISQFLISLKSPALLLKIGGKDTIRFSLFMSSFTTTFKAVLCGMRRWRESNDWKNAFVAGMAAGLTLYLDSNRSRRLMIALYLSSKQTRSKGEGESEIDGLCGVTLSFDQRTSGSFFLSTTSPICSLCLSMVVAALS